MFGDELVGDEEDGFGALLPKKVNSVFEDWIDGWGVFGRCNVLTIANAIVSERVLGPVLTRMRTPVMAMTATIKTKITT